MEYNFREIEKRWQEYWKENAVYKVDIDKTKPKYYVLDMFPYPSGAGLHVGHPLGYIASDIYSRYKRLKGFNVLHPMGYDAYGLPAEQYAIQTGRHPAITTEQNIARYRKQLDKIGFSFDWSREIRTCDPDYYKWTQWVFARMFEHWYDKSSRKARPVEELEELFRTRGNRFVNAAAAETGIFSAEEWNSMSECRRYEILLNYRIAYIADTLVNWCPALGTVLANDEVKDGLSVRGGHPVEQKKMKQWFLRVSAYAERLLEGLENLDWADSLKDIQRNWIGMSKGAEIRFEIKGSRDFIDVFTTRPDTIFGSTFMVIAPESEYAERLVKPGYEKVVAEYLEYVKKRTERERQSEVRKVTGVFTGTYAVNPFSGAEIPVWISEYVLSGYGTGAIMAVPAHDGRDCAFARKFDLPVIPVIDSGEGTDISESSYDAKSGKMVNSGMLDGMEAQEAIAYVIEEVEKKGIGCGRTNYRLRDAIFSRQRYWGEPFPVYYKEGLPYLIPDEELPLRLPDIDEYKPTETGEPPLGRAEAWETREGYPIELSTMPGFAGSSAYYLRYMDPRNTEALVGREANAYWKDVDLYMGGAEHATGHLIYSRFWNMFLYDIGLVCREEPYRKLINQGMIQGRSNFVYRIQGTNTFVSCGLKERYETTPIHVDVNIVHNDILDIEAFRLWMPDYKDAEFILEEGRYVCGWAVEKMSKSMFNVVNPDHIIAEYGADTLRLYEMFLGPLEAHKPWDTQGIDGVYKFLRKFWNLFFKGNEFSLSEAEPSKEELKILHKTIKKIEFDIENFSFNTSIPAFMICTNELIALKSDKRAVLEPLIILISPYAPHMAEELWHLSGHRGSVTYEKFPAWNEEYIREEVFEYPVSFNGKTRFKLKLNANAGREEAENAVLQAPEASRWMEGMTVKKIVFVPKKIINVVVG